MFLVFSDASQGYWWSRLLKRGFQHVSVLMLSGRTWVLVRPMYAYTDLVACEWREGDAPYMLVDGDPVILAVQPVRADRLRGLVGLQTCVTWAKALMGIRAPWVITPWQLYKHASKHYPVDIPSTGCLHSGSEHRAETAPAGRTA